MYHLSVQRAAMSRAMPRIMGRIMAREGECGDRSGGNDWRGVRVVRGRGEGRWRTVGCWSNLAKCGGGGEGE
jgi:hypothetical protein